MANPLFNLLNNSAQIPVNTPMGNAMAMLKQFQQHSLISISKWLNNFRA